MTEPISEWIIVQDVLPPIGVWVDVVCSNIVQRQAAQLQWADGVFMPKADSPKCWLWADEGADPAPLEAVTHWRLRPAPPAPRTEEK